METLGYILVCAPIILGVIFGLLEINFDDKFGGLLAVVVILGALLIWFF